QPSADSLLAPLPTLYPPAYAWLRSSWPRFRLEPSLVGQARVASFGCSFIAPDGFGAFPHFHRAGDAIRVPVGNSRLHAPSNCRHLESSAFVLLLLFVLRLTQLALILGTVILRLGTLLIVARDRVGEWMRQTA